MKIRLTSLFKNNLNLLRGKKIVCLVGLGTVLTLTGCNKKDENTSTIVYNCTCQSNLDCRPTATPSNSNDNSNNNKFISGYNGNLHVTTSQSLEEVDKGRTLDIEEENAKYFASLKDNNKTNNTTNATSNSTNNNNSSLDKVETQTQVEVTNEENTIIENEYTQVGVDENYQNTDDYEWSQDGNDVVYPEYPEYPIYPDVPSDIPTDIPSEVIPRNQNLHQLQLMKVML